MSISDPCYWGTYARSLPVGIVRRIVVAAVGKVNLRHQVLVVVLEVGRASALLLGGLIPAAVVLIIRRHAVGELMRQPLAVVIFVMGCHAVEALLVLLLGKLRQPQADPEGGERQQYPHAGEYDHRQSVREHNTEPNVVKLEGIPLELRR